MTPSKIAISVTTNHHQLQLFPNCFILNRIEIKAKLVDLGRFYVKEIWKGKSEKTKKKKT